MMILITRRNDLLDCLSQEKMIRKYSERSKLSTIQFPDLSIKIPRTLDKADITSGDVTDLMPLSAS